MRIVGRGLAFALGGAVLLAGCQAPFKCISRAEFDNYKSLERLNRDQASLITALTADKERLTNEVSALRAQLRDKGELLDAQKRLLSELQAQIDKSKPEMPEGVPGITPVLNEYGEVTLRMESDVLFDSGQASLQPKGEQILKKAAELVRDKPNKLAICGFTDSDPIRFSGWKSNFELSGARALTVLEFLKKQGIAPERMHFRGYGEYNLIRGPEGKEDKKRSRRAEIVLLMGTGEASAAPAPKAPVVPK